MKLKFIYLTFLWLIFIGCRLADQRNDLGAEPNPEWKLIRLSDYWSLYVPEGADTIMRRSSWLKEPDEIFFSFDSLRVEFRVQDLGYEPETTNFNKIAREVIADPTLGLCQGDSDDEDVYSPVIDFSMEVSGSRTESLYKGNRSSHIYLLQLKAKKLLILNFNNVNDINKPLVDSIMQTIVFSNP